jgi:hypothetical protein
LPGYQILALDLDDLRQAVNPLLTARGESVREDASRERTAQLPTAVGSGADLIGSCSHPSQGSWSWRRLHSTQVVADSPARSRFDREDGCCASIPSQRDERRVAEALGQGELHVARGGVARKLPAALNLLDERGVACECARGCLVHVVETQYREVADACRPFTEQDLRSLKRIIGKGRNRR